VLLRLLLTATLAYQLSGFAKDIWGRARPTEILANVLNLDYVVRGPGFPSGHMALATAMALTVGLYLPRKYQWIVPVWIIGVGLSRMYLGIHAPLDIAGGFAIGWLSYALFRHVRLQDIRFGKRRPSKAKA
jgi:membrane-associated phospholipid phosphatase